MEALHLTKTAGRRTLHGVLDSEGARDMGDMGLLGYHREVSDLYVLVEGGEGFVCPFCYLSTVLILYRVQPMK
jgi:hypothetical protein